MFISHAFDKCCSIAFYYCKLFLTTYSRTSNHKPLTFFVCLVFGTLSFSPPLAAAAFVALPFPPYILHITWSQSRFQGSQPASQPRSNPHNNHSHTNHTHPHSPARFSLEMPCRRSSCRNFRFHRIFRQFAFVSRLLVVASNLLLPSLLKPKPSFSACLTSQVSANASYQLAVLPSSFFASFVLCQSSAVCCLFARAHYPN